jgi:hypothetical protein
MILNYRKDKWNENPSIGCIVLTNPIFFSQEDWIPTPTDWSNSIVQGKSYSTEDAIGKYIWDQVELSLRVPPFFGSCANASGSKPKPHNPTTTAMTTPRRDR